MLFQSTLAGVIWYKLQKKTVFTSSTWRIILCISTLCGRVAFIPVSTHANAVAQFTTAMIDR